MANHKIRRLLSFVLSVFVFAGALVSQTSASSSATIDTDTVEPIAYKINYTANYSMWETNLLQVGTSGDFMQYADIPVATIENIAFRIPNLFRAFSGYQSGGEYTFTFRVGLSQPVGSQLMTENTRIRLVLPSGQEVIGNPVLVESYVVHFGFTFTVKGLDSLAGDYFFYFDFDTTYGSSFNLRFYLQHYISVTSPSGTDDILNAFGSNYSQPDTSVQDQYEDLESEAMGQIQGGIDDITSQWNDLGGTLGQYQGAFLAFNQFFNKLTGIPFFGTLVVIAVSVGVFGTLLGLTGMILSRYDGGNSDGKKGGSKK